MSSLRRKFWPNKIVLIHKRTLITLVAISKIFLSSNVQSSDLHFEKSNSSLASYSSESWPEFNEFSCCGEDGVLHTIVSY